MKLLAPLALLLACARSSALRLAPLISRRGWLSGTTTAFTGVVALTAPTNMVALADDDGDDPPPMAAMGGGAMVRRVRNKVHLLGTLDVAVCEGFKSALEDASLECLALQAAYALPAPPAVELHIQSGGGSLMPTLSVVDAILACPVPTHSYIEGYAASGATLLTVVCSKRFAHKHSVALLHQLSGGGAQGTAASMEDQHTNVQLFMSIIQEIYKTHTSIPEERLTEMLKHDIWLSSSELLELGVVDAIL